MNQSITSSWPILFITDPKSLLSIRACIILFLALVFSLPLFSVLFSIFTPNTELWLHIRDNLLLDYVSNSFLLALGVGMGTLVLGVASAWLVTMCQFPGREWFSFLLILPMAIPAYIIAYTYTGIFDVAGPLQSWLRSTFGLLYGEYWFPDIRSLGGAITVMSLVLYPYVYLISRAALLEQSVCVLEVARTLGCGPWRVFFRVALPLIRPAIIVGLSLVLMETLADYGTVQYFGVPVFTTGIFRTWFGLDNLVGAAQLSAILLMFVFALVMIELLSRRQQRFTHTSQRYSSITPFSLSPLAASLAFTFCLLVLTLGFLLPVGFMIYWAMISFSLVVDEEFYSLLWNSLTLALVTALLAIGFAMLVSYSKRSQPSGLIHLVTRILGLGYALPGTIIAIGVMVPIASFDQSVNRFITEMLGIDSRIVLSGSLAVLIFAYLVRFLAVSINTVDAALLKVKPSMDEAAMVHGRGPFAIIQQIHLPLIKSSILTALLLVFVDVLKELPVTLLLRPFNFNTLAVKAYELANEERLIEASSPALAIVITGLIPVIILSLSIAKSRPGDHASS